MSIRKLQKQGLRRYQQLTPKGPRPTPGWRNQLAPEGESILTMRPGDAACFAPGEQVSVFVGEPGADWKDPAAWRVLGTISDVRLTEVRVAQTEADPATTTSSDDMLDSLRAAWKMIKECKR